MRFPAKKLSKYPHMFPRDILVWERFLEMHAVDFLGFDYDVKVGRGIDPGEHIDENIRRNAKLLTQKRIDCVGYKLGEIWIFEVKEHATISAPGQVWGYLQLYKQTYHSTRRVVAALVAQTYAPDIETVANGLDVLMFHA